MDLNIIKRLNSEKYIRRAKNIWRTVELRQNRNLYFERMGYPYADPFWTKYSFIACILSKIDDSELRYSNQLLQNIGLPGCAHNDLPKITKCTGVTFAGITSSENYAYDHICNEEQYPGALTAYRITLYQIMDEYITEKGVINIISKYIAK